jgi:hypothetical protein
VDRKTAQEIVDGLVFKIGPFKAVANEDAIKVLGQDLFDQLKSNPVKKYGPTKSTIYPWNVVDYLSMKTT